MSLLFGDIIRARQQYILDSYRKGEPKRPGQIHIAPQLAKQIRDDLHGITDRILGMDVIEDKTMETFELR